MTQEEKTYHCSCCTGHEVKREEEINTYPLTEEAGAKHSMYGFGYVHGLRDDMYGNPRIKHCINCDQQIHLPLSCLKETEECRCFSTTCNKCTNPYRQLIRSEPSGIRKIRNDPHGYTWEEIAIVTYVDELKALIDKQQDETEENKA